MADTPQPGVPFGFGQFDFGEVMRLLQSDGPINFEVARQIAPWVALGGTEDGAGGGMPTQPPTEDPVEPEHVALGTELVRAAQIQVTAATGLGTGLEPRTQTLTRTEWANAALDGLAPLLTTLAERLTSEAPGPEALPPLPDDLASGFEGAGMGDLSSLLGAMAPLLLGVQAGFMAGHLGGLSLARHEIPLPLSGPAAVGLVAPNLLAFESDWELPHDELWFYTALHEVIYASMLSVPWVQEEVIGLTTRYVDAFEVNPAVVEERFADLDPTDPRALEQALGDPTELIGAMRTPAQDGIQSRLTVMTSVLEGYADYTLGEIGPPLIPAFDQIREACHRHRVERGEAARFLEALLGFGSQRANLEQGAAFCRGVVERAGAPGLRRLFDDRSRLPTPSELEAPGLWLERIDLPEPTDS